MRCAVCCALLLLAGTTGIGAEIVMEKVEYGGWPNCVKIANAEMELIVTTDVGPRVIRIGFVGEQNLFKDFEDMLGKAGGDQWRIYGGHRLWHAPEVKPRTYAPDNSPVEYEWSGSTLRITQPTEPSTGIQKQMEITVDGERNHVRVLHRLINRNQWGIELAPWALSVMAPGGRVILPQEPYISHQDKVLPARPLVLWNYTNMSDPRWTWGAKFVQLRQDPENSAPQKAGIGNSLGWAAYTLNGDVFIKKFPFVEDAAYPDGGCNNEVFTNESMLEVESVGALTELAPEGSVEHIEDWYLYKADVGDTDADIEKALMPLVEGSK